MKKIASLTIVVLLFLVPFLIEATTERIVIKSDEVEIATENIRLRKLDFHAKDYIDVSTAKSDKVKVEHTDDKLIISAEKMTNINMILPDSKAYFFTLDGETTCRFDKNMVQITGRKGEQITIDQNSLLVLDEEGGNQVEINRDGIFILSEKDRVEISSQGIIVESEEDSKNLTGFWGRLLGKTIRSVVKLSFKMTAGDVTGIVRQFHNEKVSQLEINFGSSSRVEKQFEGTYAGKPDLTIHVENHSGSISIEPWEKEFVDVRAILRAENDEYNLEQIEIAIWGSKSGDVCHVQTKESGKSIRVSVDYSIRVPEKAKVGSINTVSGNITIEGLSGKMELNTTNGNINGTDLNGFIKAETVNGNIDLFNTQNITNAITINGNITAEMKEFSKDALFSTKNGSIHITFLQNIQAELHAKTNMGFVRYQNLPITSHKESNMELLAKLGKGGRKLDLFSANGNITLNQK